MALHTKLNELLLGVALRGETPPTNYYLALLAAKNATTINNAAAVNVGSGVVGIPVTAHPYSTGNVVRIAGSNNYNGTYEVLSSSSTNQVNITATYIAETFAGDETIHQAPSPDDATMANVVEVATGNGYSTGGMSIARNSTDFDTLTTNATTNATIIQLKDIVFTASGGPLPSSGNAYYAVLTDDNATVSARRLLCSNWLGSETGVSVSDGQSLTLPNFTVRYSASAAYPTS